MSVTASATKSFLPTYPLGEPERNPLFFEKRVYQGSSGKVYPVPFIDKVFDDIEAQAYELVKLENEYIYLELLPEIGGRIFKGQDKTNEMYDFFYRQDVIKPALVGLAGPWLSGGVEFNWPQHHRPGTYLPTDFHIEEEPDGSKTVWMSEVDPLQRMKGMHGVRLRPESSLIELRVRLYNRTPHMQTFLWWANVAAKVHDEYQSFFPPDVHYVADHAVRAMSSFPVARGSYYGVEYAKRPGANDLSWYRNIPVPTSYMVCDTEGSFFGGYDYLADGGFVHVANKYISPGKKQWTWGNHPFGWAWDRELTDEGGPYVELMAGVYTDNQPDFSYLMPYETKTFSQFWWPIQRTGPVQEANEQAAVRFLVGSDRRIEIAVNVSRKQVGMRLVITAGNSTILDTCFDLAPGEIWRCGDLVFHGEDERSLQLRILDSNGKEVLSFSPVDTSKSKIKRDLAQEPEYPDSLDSVEELYLVGEHLEQYRHPTRDPEVYWNAALNIDPKHSRSRIALGRIALKRGEFRIALSHFKAAIDRLTTHHPNPETGEAHYYAGLCCRYLDEPDEAYEYLYKSTWNYAWKAAGYFELACIDFGRNELVKALEHVRRSLEANTENNKAVVLEALVLAELGEVDAARCRLESHKAKDPLDAWVNWELERQTNRKGETFHKLHRNDAQTVLDLAFDYIWVGALHLAEEILNWHSNNTVTEVAVANPLSRSQSVGFVRAWILARTGKLNRSKEMLGKAEEQEADYFFPSRLEEQIVLEWANSINSGWLSHYALGNYYYDRRRRVDAIREWEAGTQSGSKCPTLYRNLGIAYWNSNREGEKARKSYLRALELDPQDARVVVEFSQLQQRLGDSVDDRYTFLKDRENLVLTRDDATVEFCSLLNDLGKFADSLNILESRRFHPWEGGEGKVLAQYSRAKIGLGRQALESGDYSLALEYFQHALDAPENLGEAYHLLQAKAEVNYWIGKAKSSLGDKDGAAKAFEKCAAEEADFQDMAVVEYSELSYFKGLALAELNRHDEAVSLFERMITWSEREKGKEAKIDYFATSLPNLLVFEDDLKTTKATKLEEIAELARKGLQKVAVIIPGN